MPFLEFLGEAAARKKYGNICSHMTLRAHVSIL